MTEVANRGSVPRRQTLDNCSTSSEGTSRVGLPGAPSHRCPGWDIRKVGPGGSIEIMLTRLCEHRSKRAAGLTRGGISAVDWAKTRGGVQSTTRIGR